jgi:serine protease Do
LTVKDTLHLAHDEPGPLRTVVVERVEAGSAAAQAGLQRGDVLVKIGEVGVASSLDVERGLLDVSVGEQVPLVVRRGNGDRKMDVVLEASRISLTAVPGNQDVIWRKLGLRLQAVNTEDVARSHPQLHGGLAVTEVRSEGAAAKAGIQRGDILVGLHQWEMLTLDNILFVMNHPDLSTFNPLRFYILRAGQVHRGWMQSLD